MSPRTAFDALMSTAVLATCWLLWSGHTNPLMLSLGAGSVAFCVIISWRMGVVDKEGHPYHLGWRPFVYVPWLILEIVKANIDVTRRILTGDISPTMVTVKASQKTILGQVIYGNSITLTPGTITLRIRNGEILVHALSKGGAEDLASGEMDKKATWLEGEA